VWRTINEPVDNLWLMWITQVVRLLTSTFLSAASGRMERGCCLSRDPSTASERDAACEARAGVIADPGRERPHAADAPTR
jgi:hypothetical protein